VVKFELVFQRIHKMSFAARKKQHSASGINMSGGCGSNT
jgi:hypothetical protein